VTAAMPIVAAQGFNDFALDDVAARADVTRNLLYHYFPRGRQDIVLAVVERSGEELTDGWVTDESIPLEERLAANLARIAYHALKPTDAWLVHRHARAAVEPELNEVVRRFGQIVISSVSLNHLGTRNPPPLVRVALIGFVSFVEAVLDEARLSNVPYDRVMEMIAGALVSTIQSALAASGDAVAR
jgi:AcrR family transcriptional regulator